MVKRPPHLKRNACFGAREYFLFDWCATEDEAKGEITELHKAGYLARRSRAGEGYSIWCARKVIYG